MGQWTPAIVVQAIITILLVIAIVAMSMLGREVPKELWTMASIAVGWFGAGGATAIALALRRR